MELFQLLVTAIGPTALTLLAGWYFWINRKNQKAVSGSGSGTTSNSKTNGDVIVSLEAIKKSMDERAKSQMDWCKEHSERFRKMERQIEDLHDWHDQHDEDGAFKWYIKKSLEVALVAQTSAAQAMTVVIAKLATAVDRLHREKDGD